MNANDLKTELNAHEDPTHAGLEQRFFKTYKGGYAEGDIFIGLRVPLIRKLTKAYATLPLSEIEELLESPIHEHRFAGLVIMTMQARKADETSLRDLYQLYLRRTDRINNWDLVDVSCRDVVGHYLYDKSRQPLYELAVSPHLWERRIAMVSTAYFIGKHDLNDTFKIAQLLLHDDHDLIHKAVGWMLREAGKKDEAQLLAFLDKYAAIMPRTALRYSLERLNQVDKQHYMTLKLT
ncbi:DNA alkylation repair protein [Candidatus Saccharibacteria bacterium]|nr:DNA alkylation repair protein [Candidatus Saccharibacteria bacterium]